MKNILLTTDFSSCSTTAFAVAKELQHVFAAQLTIAAVAEGDDEESLRAQKAIDSLRRTHFEQVPARTTIIRTRGSVPLDLADYATSHSVDLIVIASHGRSGLERAIFGSVAEGLLRVAKCPVLVVPFHAIPQATNHEGFHIVVTTDLSEASEAALPVAKSFLMAYGSTQARATLLHISENMVSATFNSPLGGSSKAIRREVEGEAEEAMNRLQSKYLGGTLAMTTVIRGTDAVHQEIISYVDSHDADILILASHGHSKLGQVLFGSVADKLVRLSGRKVLVVPCSARNA